MKQAPKKPADRLLLALFALGIVASFVTGAYIAQRWVSPCVCVFATPARIS